jgi:hypothetical protein
VRVGVQKLELGLPRSFILMQATKT